jgi:hypothetical protein
MAEYYGDYGTNPIEVSRDNADHERLDGKVHYQMGKTTGKVDLQLLPLSLPGVARSRMIQTHPARLLSKAVSLLL